jgi:adenine-specific DNA-methyltransferase
MPTLTWIGKEKVVNHHHDVPFRVLEHKYAFTQQGQRQEQVNSGNKIIHGDNLEALKSLLPEYEGKIKCIYIDPPYNTGNENWVYNDKVNHPKIQKWLQETLAAKKVGKEHVIGIDDLARHDKWLCMMYPRLQLLQKLLSPDGAIFVSIDDNELVHLKLIMDEIFGRSNFVDFFSWKKSETPANLSFKTKKAVEYVVCYQKKKNTVRFKGLQKQSGSDNPLIKPDNSSKILHFKAEWIKTNIKSGKFLKGLYGTQNNKIELLDDVEIADKKVMTNFSMRANFIWLQEKLEQEISHGTEIRIKTKTFVPSYEKLNYDPEVPWNLIDNSFGVGTTQEGGDILKRIFNQKVFDFPKTPSLIGYLAGFLCDKDDIILDSFAGSGTTAHAVLNLNKQDNGNRKFILVEMENYAEAITAERVKRVIKGYGETEGTGGSFDYYELGKPLFVGDHIEMLNPEVDTEKIREYIWFSETRSPYKAGADPQSPYFLGNKGETGYYFFFEKELPVALDYDSLAAIKSKSLQYVIYADNCLLPTDFMVKYNIVFKKIPRDISRI